MTSIRYRLRPSETKQIDAPDGQSVMKAALAHGVPGIVGECGGELSCATCHISVDAEWADRLDPRSSDEEDMLEMLDDRTEYSRLSCQIEIRPELDGLAVQVMEN